ncbi:MFS transporter [Jiangella rhizosphaerae]|uniref:MFS transporter n=1 Tax=Jiangella rhizosphaerae TaxID=2293569 RepID=A0A418KPR5_9ACTN|nr:MFS transporter [Jiangella rhizosphaerae]RIQ21505.1 MFS transporter [Jiangella rhizosphaerae]
MVAPDTLARPQTRTRALLPLLAVVMFAVVANYAALLSVLLPNHVEAIDADRKVTNLAIVTSVSFAFTILAQPLVGALSDRTRGPLGRRAPWLLAGAVVAAGFLLGLGGLGSVAWICVFWVVVQFALNGTDVAVAATLADHVPPARRGRASAVLAGGGMAGAAAGTAFAGPLATDHRPVAYTVLGLTVVAAAAVFVLVNRSMLRDDAASAAAGRRLLRGFWPRPRQHADFLRVFGSRLLFVLGYQLILTYQLYILTDYVGLGRDDANRLIGLLTVLGFATTVVGIVVGGWWSDRTGRRVVFLVAAAGILGLALAVPLVSATTTAVTAFAAIQGLAGGLYLACGNALAIDVLPDRAGAAGKDLGLFNVAVNVPQTIAPPIAALVINLAGGYRPLFAVALASVAASAVLVTRVRHTGSEGGDAR